MSYELYVLILTTLAFYLVFWAGVKMHQYRLACFAFFLSVLSVLVRLIIIGPLALRVFLANMHRHPCCVPLGRRSLIRNHIILGSLIIN